MKVADPAIYKIRKESILQHACHLFATRGYAETSMDDIAQSCKMQKASLYHYFASKHQILKDMIDLQGERWTARLKDYESGETLRDALTTIAMSFIKDMDDPGRRDFFKIIYFESHKEPVIFKAWKESPTQDRERFFAVFARFLSPRLDRKQIAMFITQFMGSIFHYVSASRLRAENTCFETFDDASYVSQLVDVCCKGLA